MIQFDAEYYRRLHAFLNQQDDVRYKISDLSDDPEKFIFHVKYYIDTRTGDDLHVEFNSLTETEIMYGATYSEIRVLEFFSGIISQQQKEKMINKLWQNASKLPPAKPKPVEVKKEEPPPAPKKEVKKSTVPPGYKTPGLFQ